MLARLDDIDDWFSALPMTGSIYQLQAGDELVRVASQALHYRLPRGSRRLPRRKVLEYVHAISGGPLFNLRNYGSPSFSRRFPAELLVPGLGLGLHAAFMPINESARMALQAGRLPQRAVSDQGLPTFPRVGHSRGALFLPPLDTQELRSGRIAVASWPCGSSAIDPPPSLLERIRA